VLYNNWHINLPKGTEVLTQYKNTNWFGEGTKVFVIRVDKQETTDTFFDLKNLHGIGILWSVLFIPPIVYLVCVIIEFIRRTLCGRMENYILDAIAQRWKLN